MARTRIYIGNIPFTAHTTDIINLFDSIGIGIFDSDIVMPLHAVKGTNTGYAFVELHDLGRTSKALADLQNKDFKGRTLYVGYATRETAAQRARVHWNQNSHPLEAQIGRLPFPSTNDERLPATTTNKGRHLYAAGFEASASPSVFEHNVRAFFSDFQVLGVHPAIPFKHLNTCTKQYCYTFVDMLTDADAEDAIRLLDGRRWPLNPPSKPIRVQFAMGPRTEKKEVDHKTFSPLPQEKYEEQKPQKELWVSTDGGPWEFLTHEKEAADARPRQEDSRPQPDLETGHLGPRKMWVSTGGGPWKFLTSF